MSALSSLIRKGAKTAVLPFGFGRRRTAGDVVILLYHGVGVDTREIDLSTSVFARQMASVGGQHVVRLDDVIDGGERGGVVVTFDDGGADFHERALPILVRNEIPVTLYLCTGYVAAGRMGAVRRALTWSQVEEAMATGLVTVGSHGHRHADLARAPAAVVEDDMRRSKDLIEDRLSTACRHFASPGGTTSPIVEELARRIYASAALGWGTNRAGRWDRHRLGRTPVLRSDGGLLFRAKLRGMLDAEAGLYRILRRGPWAR